MVSEERIGKAMLVTVNLALALKKKYREDHKARGEIDCPVCKGTIDYSVHDSKKLPTRGKCRTKDCVTWME